MGWKDTNSHVEFTRPQWDQIFLKIADDIASRSTDSQYQAGSVIVDKNHHILSVGFNGFIAGIDDSWLPNTRPDKYDFMIHSELNAILSCEHRPCGATIYVNGPPCLHCLQCIIQSGIIEIVHTPRKATMVNKEMDTKIEIIKWLAKDKVFIREINNKEKWETEDV